MEAFLKVVVVGLISLVIYIFGMVVQESRIQKDAIKHGVAHWEINEEGEKKFVWNTPADKKEGK